MVSLAMVAFVGTVAVGCSSDDKDDVDFNRVEINLSDEDLEVIGDDKIKVEINLAFAVSKDETIGLKLEGNEGEYVSLSSNIVEIKAGEKSGFVTLTSNQNYDGGKPLTITISIDQANTSLTDVELIASKTFVLKPELCVDLDEDDKAKLSAYKEKTGFDFTNLLGKLDVKLTIIYNSDDSQVFFEGEEKYIYEGKTFIDLADEATNDTFIFDMEDNPMGMTEWIKSVYYMQTFYNTEFFNVPKTAKGKICDLLEYDPKNPGDVEFDIEMDSLYFKIADIKDNKVGVEHIVKIYKDSWGDECNTINFDYDFDLEKRLAKLVKDGASFVLNENGNMVEHTVKEYVEDYGFTISPKGFISTSSVLEDEWESEPSLFLIPNGVIDFAAGKMIYEFPIDFEFSEGGYSKVRAEYTFPTK